MGKFYKKLALLTCFVSCFSSVIAYGQQSPSQTGTRVGISSITPSINTGQNFSPWLNDDLNDMVQSVWSPLNSQYIDITLSLANRTDISRLSLYDWQGVFTNTPVTLYALNGTQRTLLGTFTGTSYMQWVDITMYTPVAADAIIVRKYGNDIPQKIQVFGSASTPPTLLQSVVNFSTLAVRTVGDAPFDLVATSNNAATPITFVSSNPAVATVSNATGRWQATIGIAGTATISASQTGNSSYLAAANVAQPMMVQATHTGTITGKIPIDPQRWYQPTNSPDGVQALFDGIITDNVSVGYGQAIDNIDSFYPLQVGETFAIERIKFYDGQASNADVPMTLSIITDTWQRIPIATFTGAQYEQWVGPYPNRPATFALDNIVRNARYLVITSSWLYPTEIELYGSYTIPAPVQVPSSSTLATQKQIKLRQSLGVNAFEWDLEDANRPWEVDTVRLRAVKNFTGIRHYMDWEKLESTQGSYTFNPVHSGGWNYDAMYEELQQEGIEVLACLKTLPGWMLATYPAAERDAENVPVLYGQDFTSPIAYTEQAKVAFQYAARYGSNPYVNRNLLSVNSVPRWNGDGINQVRVGLSYIKYIECDNERDKWWKGRKAYQTAFEYAANLSAFYDGHKNTMGLGVGVKNADPTMQVVMGGLASPNPDYVKAMIDWCRQFRGYKADGSVNLCWDIINYHQYSNDAGTSQGGNSTRGAAPEVSEAGRIAKAFVLMAHQYAGNMPVWITETGYDLNQGSPLKAIAIGNKSVLETQADWTLRTALAYARWGVERVFMYQLYDDNPLNPIQFGSMGLVNTDKTPRPAAQYLSQVNKLMGSYTYKETLNNDPIVDRYELNGRSAYMLVVPDERGRTAQYTLNLNNASYVDVYRPVINSQSMTSQRINLQNGALSILVTETPVFVLTADSPPHNSCSATGSILREEWSNIPGWSVVDIPLQNAPNSSSQLSQLESSSVGDNYGARIRGYVCPPQSGAYTFWIAGDDTAELWLSTDDDPTNKVRIASAQGWTNPREWTKSTAQQSSTVVLVAGQRYYVEVIHKEQAAGDHVAVAWQLPNRTVEGPIPGNYLSPYITTARPATSTIAAVKSSNVNPSILHSASSKNIELTISPNPFSSECNIRFKSLTTSQATITVYDIQGRLVQELFSGNVKADENREVILTSTTLPAGLYNIRLMTSTEVVHRRVVLVK